MPFFLSRAQGKRKNATGSRRDRKEKNGIISDEMEDEESGMGVENYSLPRRLERRIRRNASLCLRLRASLGFS